MRKARLTALQDPALLLESEARIAREELRRIAVAEVHQEVRLAAPVGEEFAVDDRVVETGHRPAVQSQGAGSEDQIAALQRAVAERGDLGERRVVLEPVD